MDYKPHILRPAGNATPKPPIKRLSPAADEIRERAIADADRSFQKVRGELRKLVASRVSRPEG